MKRILILLFHYYPYADSNTNVVLPLLQKCKERGYEIHLLTLDKGIKKLPEEEYRDGVYIHRFYADKNKVFTIMNSFADEKNVDSYPLSHLLYL